MIFILIINPRDETGRPHRQQMYPFKNTKKAIKFSFSKTIIIIIISLYLNVSLIFELQQLQLNFYIIHKFIYIILKTCLFKTNLSVKKIFLSLEKYKFCLIATSITEILQFFLFY